MQTEEIEKKYEQTCRQPEFRHRNKTNLNVCRNADTQTQEIIHEIKRTKFKTENKTDT